MGTEELGSGGEEHPEIIRFLVQQHEDSSEYG